MPEDTKHTIVPCRLPANQVRRHQHGCSRPLQPQWREAVALGWEGPRLQTEAKTPAPTPPGCSPSFSHFLPAAHRETFRAAITAHSARQMCPHTCAFGSFEPTVRGWHCHLLEMRTQTVRWDKCLHTRRPPEVGHSETRAELGPSDTSLYLGSNPSPADRTWAGTAYSPNRAERTHCLLLAARHHPGEFRSSPPALHARAKAGTLTQEAP